MIGRKGPVIDLSNDVFFHIIYCQLTNISEIEQPSSDHNTGAGAVKKQIKTNKINNFFRKKIIANQCPILILHIQIKT